MNKGITGVIIILYNPELKRLRMNLDSIAKQSQNILCIDNASGNLKEVKNLLGEYEHIRLLENPENEGIAVALNQGMDYWDKEGVQWVLSLDQDSVCPDGFLEKLESCIEMKDNTAIICPQIMNKGQGIIEAKVVFEQVNEKVRSIDYTITSGSLMNIEKWKAVGKYDEKLFIDWVDVDICLRMCKMNFGILENSDARLEHQIGETQTITFMGKKYYPGNHSPFRKYYIIRNNFYMSKKKQRPLVVAVKFTIREYLFVLLYEKQKWKKICAMSRGIKDSIKMKCEE